MKTRIICWLLLVILMTAGVFTVQTLLEQRALAQKTVRLHVVANSDSADDQEQKLRVRDAILRQVSALTVRCRSADEARAVLSDHLDGLRSAALDVLRAENSQEEIRVTLETERFDTRRYDTFTLPAGEYPSLRVCIGRAEGKNWWCVVFPSLCTAATASDVGKTAEAGGFDRTESELITGGPEEYRLRFKTLEWLKSLSDFLFR